ncbi:MAG: NUDIX hydrolase [Bacteroidota bacterium]
MYKVFLNDRLMQIGAPEKITINKPSVTFSDWVEKDEIKKWFLSFLKDDFQEVYLLHPRPEHFFEIFRNSFSEIRAAGGVVKSAGKILFIYRRGKWDLPKGKIDKGETSEEAAVREVAEECGISGHEIIKQLTSTYHIYESPYSENKGEWIFKETFWFEMNYTGTFSGKPQTEEDILEVKWIAAENLDEVLANTYANLKQIIGLYRS